MSLAPCSYLPENRSTRKLESIEESMNYEGEKKQKIGQEGKGNRRFWLAFEKEGEDLWWSLYRERPRARSFTSYTYAKEHFFLFEDYYVIPSIFPSLSFFHGRESDLAETWPWYGYVPLDKLVSIGATRDVGGWEKLRRVLMTLLSRGKFDSPWDSVVFQNSRLDGTEL